MRPFHAYCLGTSKSGTHSLAGLFQPYYSAAHEPEHYECIQYLLAGRELGQSRTQLEAFLSARDLRLQLALESSNLLSFFVEALVKLFPAARFIVTIRDCYSWLDSCLNHQLNASRTVDVAFWWRYRDFCFRTEPFVHRPEEAVLARHHLYSVEGYLLYWQRVNQRILQAIPAERRLIVRTGEIGECLGEIAAFLQISVATLNRSHVHLYRAARRYNLLRQIDSAFLEQMVARYCQELMDCYFPSIQTVDDVLP